MAAEAISIAMPTLQHVTSGLQIIETILCIYSVGTGKT